MGFAEGQRLFLKGRQGSVSLRTLPSNSPIILGDTSGRNCSFHHIVPQHLIRAVQPHARWTLLLWVELETAGSSRDTATVREELETGRIVLTICVQALDPLGTQQAIVRVGLETGRMYSPFIFELRTLFGHSYWWGEIGNRWDCTLHLDPLGTQLLLLWNRKNVSHMEDRPNCAPKGSWSRGLCIN